MVVQTPFAAESIKDQLALLKALTAHIDPDGGPEQESTNYKILIDKMEKAAKHLSEKLEEIKKNIDN